MDIEKEVTVAFDNTIKFNRRKRDNEEIQDNNINLTSNKKFKDSHKSTIIDNFIGRIFEGQLNQRIKCSECETSSSSKEAFIDISLSLKNAKTLFEAVINFTAPERLKDNNKFQCTECHTSTEAVRYYEFTELPPVLTVHLKELN